MNVTSLIKVRKRYRLAARLSKFGSNWATSFARAITSGGCHDSRGFLGAKAKPKTTVFKL
jgi:hypothetical protein